MADEEQARLGEVLALPLGEAGLPVRQLLDARPDGRVRRAQHPEDLVQLPDLRRTRLSSDTRVRTNILSASAQWVRLHVCAPCQQLGGAQHLSPPLSGGSNGGEFTCTQCDAASR